jgi:hypothetical protein
MAWPRVCDASDPLGPRGCADPGRTWSPTTWSWTHDQYLGALAPVPRPKRKVRDPIGVQCPTMGGAIRQRSVTIAAWWRLYTYQMPLPATLVHTATERSSWRMNWAKS